MAPSLCLGESTRLSQPLAARINQQAMDKIQDETLQEATNNEHYYFCAF